MDPYTGDTYSDNSLTKKGNKQLLHYFTSEYTVVIQVFQKDLKRKMPLLYHYI